MTTKKISFLALLFLLVMTTAFAQAPPTLPVDFIVTQKYPSLAWVPLLRVKIAIAFGTTDPCQWPNHFDPTSLSSYRVTNDKGAAIQINSVEFLPSSGGPSVCPPGSPRAGLVLHNDLALGVAFLAVNQGIHNKDKLSVSLLADGTEIAKTSNPAEVKGFPDWTFNLNPQAVPGEKLVNGNKRDVGQVTVNLSTPDLFKWNFARSYIESSDVISTDERDTNSKVEGTFGFEHNLTPAWYLPAHLESKAQGDQVGRNLSFLEGFGLSTLLPWRGLRPVLFNSAIQAPVSPIITLDAQYERRINQDADSLKKFPNQNDFRLNPALSWTPIRLLPGVTQCLAKTSDLFDVEINFKSWYLPNDKTARGNQRLEAGGDISLLIPLQPFSRLAVIGPALALLNPDQSNPGKTRIRIKYSAGANDANGFKHSRQWNFGLEASK
jgi:hypothetical protein